MEITRVVSINNDELALFIQAGNLLGTMKAQKEAKEFDTIQKETRDLLEALRDVINTILA